MQEKQQSRSRKIAGIRLTDTRNLVRLWFRQRTFFHKPMILTAIPLVIVFSLCYAATRYEDLRSIFRHTYYFGGWLAFAMILVAGIMELIQWSIR